MSRIAWIGTVRLLEQPNALWVEVADEDGLVGLGETYYLPTAVEAVIHDMAAPLLLGTDAARIGMIAETLFSRASFYGWAGAEMRAFSALDIALWDLQGKRTGLSVAELLGGRARDEIRVYNTCVDAGGFDDATSMLTRPGDLAEELLEGGVAAMKVWPWDRYAPQIESELGTGPGGWSAMGLVGHDLTPASLSAGLRCIEEIRERVGPRMDVMVEGHSRWDLNAALRICRALEPFEVAWVEDIMQPASARDLARLVRETRVPQAVSERLIGRSAYRDILEAEAAHLVMVDVVWTGGLSEARKIADLADAYHLPLVPHDCVGPVALAAALQLCAHTANAKVMETVRGFLAGWYHDVVTDVPVIVGGGIQISDRPGLGLELLPGVRDREGAVVRRSGS
ncbi:MAG: mandelate racemase/muconate lactonizing enzyme family protein [Actinobacteria bacterium]|nr:mandelate racemase/muconate lactonizing enzyme family protein [Actinomycetota bacterium]